MTTKLTQSKSRRSSGPGLDVRHQDLLQRPSILRGSLQPVEPLGLPVPIFSQHPELLGDDLLPADHDGTARAN